MITNYNRTIVKIQFLILKSVEFEFLDRKDLGVRSVIKLRRSQN